MKFSIVVPSYNQAQYLEDCLDSIVNQRGADKEIIVMDGGSTDGSAEIIKRYEPHLAYWQSEKDGGQAAAINAGFAKATGDVLGWLCSDDMLAPAALRKAGEKMSESGCEMLTGRSVSFSEADNPPWLTDFTFPTDVSIKYKNYIDQPSTFWTRSLWEKAGPLRPELHFTFDWEWWIRAEAIAGPPCRTNQVFAFYRWHEINKTANPGVAGILEAIEVWKTHIGPEAVAIARHLARRKRLYRSARIAGRLLNAPNLAGAILSAGCPSRKGHTPKSLEMMAVHLYWALRKHTSSELPF